MCEPVVNFSELSNDKKQEFLNFLLNNNIKFQEGSDNYIAKVTLKDSKLSQKENRRPRSPALSKSTVKSVSAHPAVSNIKKQKPLQPLTNKDQVKKQPVDFEQIFSPAKVKKRELNQSNMHQVITLYQTPKSQRNSFVLPSPNNLRSKSRSKSVINKQTFSSLVGKRRNKMNRQSQHISSSKIKINTSLQLMKAADNMQQTTLTIATRHIQTNHSGLSYKPLPRPSLNYPANKLHELLTTLKVPSVPGRPTRLPRTQVFKIIQEVYNGNFTKNTILLKNRKFKEAYERGSCVFSAYVVEHFEERYKTTKLYQGHMLNLAHSLLCYTHQAHPPSSLIMFYKFIVQDFEYQDLVFFLFVRSIFEREFGQIMEKQTNYNSNRIYQEHMLTKKQVTRFIKAILGKDSQQIVSEFQQLIFAQMDECILMYDLFTILLLDYQSKRKSKIRITSSNRHLSNVDTNITVSPTNLNNSVSSSIEPEEEIYRKNKRKHLIIQAPSNSHNMNSKCSMFHSANSSNFEELTFGDYNLSNRLEEEDQTEFWNDFESLKTSYGDSLFQQLEHKLKKKVSELVEIMLGDEENLWNGPARHLGQLILQKSLRMFEAIISMDKIKWFKLLRIQKPTQHNLEVVQKLQLMLRNIRRLSKSNKHNECLEMKHLQSEFCKALLTVEQLKRAIEKIVIG